ncbi:MAG TPA: hypothetical protein VF808_19755 [Ktedonobacterales bacterium]
MKRTAIALRIFSGLDGLALITLGLFIWVGNADALITLHMSLGIALIVALWVLAALAAVSGVAPGLIVTGVVWGLLTVALGLAQTRILPDSGHWIIETLHLLVGVVAVVLTQILATRIASGPRASRDAGRAPAV